MSTLYRSIPRPLVRTNQWFIVISVFSALISHQVVILFLPLVTGILGLTINFNPIMRVAKLFLKKELSTYIPEDYEQQQFNQWIAVICLTIAVISYFIGWIPVYFVFSILVSLAAFIAIMGFCIGCFLRFQLVKYRHKRDIRNG